MVTRNTDTNYLVVTIPRCCQHCGPWCRIRAWYHPYGRVYSCACSHKICKASSNKTPVSTETAGLEYKLISVHHRSRSYLDKANAQLFAPHGLFALVMTFKPDQQSQILSVNTLSSSSRAVQGSPLFSSGNGGNAQAAQNTTYGEFQLPRSAPLVLPDSRPGSSDQPKNTLVKMGDFVADYNDRRAQARYVILSVPCPYFDC